MKTTTGLLRDSEGLCAYADLQLFEGEYGWGWYYGYWLILTDKPKETSEAMGWGKCNGKVNVYDTSGCGEILIAPRKLAIKNPDLKKRVEITVKNCREIKNIF